MNSLGYRMLCNECPSHMLLRIYVDSSDASLKELYKTSATNHNLKLLNDMDFYDAGFDIFTTTDFDTCTTNFWKCDFQIKCCATIVSDNGERNRFTPFYTYARSSLAKSPLRLANNQGIIDAGYRGNLIGMFDVINYSSASTVSSSMPKYSRLLQICAPSLMPIYVVIVDTIEELGPETSRGTNGIGSTGLTDVKK